MQWFLRSGAHQLVLNRGLERDMGLKEKLMVLGKVILWPVGK